MKFLFLGFLKPTEARYPALPYFGFLKNFLLPVSVFRSCGNRFVIESLF
jgi:hypothetical protein